MLALEAFGGEMADDVERCVYVANAGAELRGEVFPLRTCCALPASVPSAITRAAR